MKLNLVPTTVGRESKGRVAWVFFALMVGASIFSVFFMKTRSEEFIAQQQKRINDAAPQVTRAVSYVTKANELIQNNRGTILNAQLATKMGAHCDVYPDLLTDLKQYIPGWFRINSMQATPVGENTSVTFVGVIKDQQQYADLMLAMLRIKGVVSVARNGFSFQNPRVAALTPEDQTGRVRKPGEPAWPDDPIRRLEMQIAAATSTDFQNVGGFGSVNEPIVRQAMPGWHNVSVSVLIQRSTQSPNPIAAVRSTASMWPSVTAAPAGGGTPPAGSAPAKPATATPSQGDENA